MRVFSFGVASFLCPSAAVEKSRGRTAEEKKRKKRRKEERKKNQKPRKESNKPIVFFWMRVRGERNDALVGAFGARVEDDVKGTKKETHRWISNWKWSL